MTLQAAVYQHLFIIICITLVFYGVFPLIGAFAVRKRWRKFRLQLTAASLKPSLTYSAVHHSKFSGSYRIFGSLQAVQEDHIVWLTDGNISVSVDLEGIPVYILPSVPKGEPMLKSGKYPDESPRRTYWNRIYSLPESTSIFVSGEIVHAEGKSLFRETKNNPLTVVIYDCDDSDFYSHSVLTGRQRNEYWNTLTPGSLTIGSFSLFIYFYTLIQVPYMQFAAVAAITFSLIPITPLLPPGLGFYYIYRYLWKRARILRAERDLLRLPVNFFSGKGDITEKNSVVLPDGLIYHCMIRDNPWELWEKYYNAAYRSSSLLKKHIGEKEYFAFGSEGEGLPDPMAETLVIPGNPELLAVDSDKWALRYEILSVFSFGLGLFLNLFIFLIAITWIIR